MAENKKIKNDVLIETMYKAESKGRKIKNYVLIETMYKAESKGRKIKIKSRIMY